ncbi:hypothetical protein GLOIN_2v1778528 [Rhizophagus irregularis DAOM 181602=DAOM 197198]|uniref:Uncharacterized protein n=2 Tax=Rhizophagus irregularis TaxID=588596 RepID=A0A2P4PRW3_RHIID|nr:hypothetical protein GLOIN_2v1778528 [Rhizophagus irregularis DAOM 181602=DAOM 197198]POG68135.1 hypothetical protein GLOIN_2v1778528 [Rhizophagus irregularis DAOM 181602=DAOM 197198]|eukprot:XP_025175001.1 hypothetical protein GLOIN_2v1778528 [Rhizophagus irregularis DAOM 181602=DAOM 197198]
MVKLGKHLTKRIAKKPVAKKPKLTCTLDDITFNNCEKLKRYKKLKEHPYFQEVIDENTVRSKYILNSHFDMKFIKLLKNKNLKKLFCASANSDEAEIWLQLAELGRKGAFTTNKTFEELVRLMVQIKKLETAGKRKTGIWHFHSKDQDILTSPEISLENIACFAKIANELHWKGPVVLITDCMKL